MMPDDRMSLLGFRYGERSLPPKPRLNEDTIKTGQLQIERKTFYFKLKENARGRFLRISEDAGGHRNSIMIPSTGLAEFQKVMLTMISASDSTPPPGS